MQVVIASGKGGTGKTTVATNLALVCHGDVQLLDCDVEGPNCHIFVNPVIAERRGIEVLVPAIDESKCTACGECAEACQYNALAALNTKPLVFPELCHGCGACSLVCPEDAISERGREIGVVERGRRDHTEFVQGRLRVGEAQSPPLIRRVKELARPDALTIVDAPPGTACPVVTAINGADYVVLVTVPTPFGLNDLRLAIELVRQLGIPFGVVVNRAGIGNGEVSRFCREKRIPVLLEIPDDRRLAEVYAAGEMVIEAIPEYRETFARLIPLIMTQVTR